jgi:hypothetical protein
LSVSKGAQSVHPTGHPISHSTHVGFSFPPTDAASVGVFRVASDGALSSFALCAVGVGHIAKRAIAPRVGRSFAPALADLLNLLPVSIVVGVESNDPDSLSHVRRTNVGSG